MTERPMFTIFTHDGGAYDMYVDRWGIRGNRAFFHRGTQTEPWFDLPVSDLAHVYRNR